MKKFDSLQVYRAIAAILVVLLHLTNFSQEKFDYAFLGIVEPMTLRRCTAERRGPA